VYYTKEKGVPFNGLAASEATICNLYVQLLMRKKSSSTPRISYSHPFSGANPTIASYNASVVNFYNATGSLARFEKKNIIFYFLKRSSLLQHWRCGWKF
jgi:hypothetical protein